MNLYDLLTNERLAKRVTTQLGEYHSHEEAIQKITEARQKAAQRRKAKGATQYD